MCQVLYQTLTIFLIIFATTLRCRLWCYVISQVKKLRKRTQVRHPKCTASSHTASCHTLGCPLLLKALLFFKSFPTSLSSLKPSRIFSIAEPWHEFPTPCVAVLCSKPYRKTLPYGLWVPPRCLSHPIP